MTEKEFEEVTGASNLFAFEKEGDKVEGVLKEPKEGLYGKQAQIEIENGDIVSLPSLTVLMTKMADIKIGSFVRVTYIGEAVSKKSGAKYKDFKVEIAKA